MKNKATAIGLLAVLLALSAFTACKGAEGPAGPEGSQGPQGPAAGLVTLGAGSPGIPGVGFISGLATGTYVVNVGSKWQGVTSSGTLGSERDNFAAAVADAASITGFIYGLSTGKTYNVYQSVPTSGTVTALHNVIVADVGADSGVNYKGAAGTKTGTKIIVTLDDALNGNESTLDFTSLPTGVLKTATPKTYTGSAAAINGATLTKENGKDFVIISNVTPTFAITLTRS